jgi:phage-related protein
MSNDLATDQLKQEIDSGYVELYELEIGVDSGDGNTLYFHPGVQENLTDITYDGNTYIALPIMMDGIQMNSDGAIPRPTLTIANVESMLKNGSKFKTQMDDGTWGSTVAGAPFVSSDFRIDDLVGATLTRRKTLEKYLSSSPVIEFDKDEYIIDRIRSRDNIFVTLELASPLDLGGMRVPNRVVIGKYCPWVYRGASNEFVESKRSGACTWKTENQLAKADNARASVFLNDKDCSNVHNEELIP